MTINLDDVDGLAKILWNYHHVNHKLKKADLIFLLCSHDLEVARYGAKLYLEGYAPLVAISGGIAHTDDLLKTGWLKPEAEMFADTALESGVPRERILLETKAKNTGENFRLTDELLGVKNLNPKVVICVQKPYMERRTLATGLVHWKNRELIVVSAPISFEEYTGGMIPKENIINIMVGDLQRIKLYGEKGYQVPQEIPDEVWLAYERLIALGYDKHLVNTDHG